MIRLGLLLLTVGVVVACQRSPQSGASIDAVSCDVVEHVAGTACVPEKIQRLVTLDGVIFEYAIAADLEPIATVTSEFQAQLPPLMTNAQNIGKGGEPSLEAIVSLKPDLIVGLDFQQGIYPQLSQIAPTLLVPFEHSGQWKEAFLKTGAALSQKEAARAKLKAYQARTADFQGQMGEQLNDLQISVVRLYPDTINLYLKDSFCGTVLQDAGLARPPSQTIGAVEAEQRFGSPIQTSISRELLAQADGDVIFIWTGENTAAANQEAQERLQKLQQDPLWGQLKAVQAGRVYQVPSYWIGSGPIAANAILDDLFKYLVEEA
ncbi:iron-siderophore ABC transporter substrate-binding protein [Sphaerothrix gracilis]|uniref:iron-siderophore ABC transporter substrate-binding protein n=1 Tax=Sphaerothrix gracilis TaxID=3151835 RepID=UPI003D15FFB9